MASKNTTTQVTNVFSIDNVVSMVSTSVNVTDLKSIDDVTAAFNRIGTYATRMTSAISLKMGEILSYAEDHDLYKPAYSSISDYGDRALSISKSTVSASMRVWRYVEGLNRTGNLIKTSIIGEDGKPEKEVAYGYTQISKLPYKLLVEMSADCYTDYSRALACYNYENGMSANRVIETLKTSKKLTDKQKRAKEKADAEREEAENKKKQEAERAKEVENIRKSVSDSEYRLLSGNGENDKQAVYNREVQDIREDIESGFPVPINFPLIPSVKLYTEFTTWVDTEVRKASISTGKQITYTVYFGVSGVADLKSNDTENTCLEYFIHMQSVFAKAVSDIVIAKQHASAKEANQ